MLGVKKGNRLTFVWVMTLLVFAIIVVRLFQLQIIEHEKWLSMAESGTMRQLVIPARRGEIYARDGRDLAPLVLNQTVWSVFLDPVVVSNGDRVKQILEENAKSKILPNLDIDAVLADGERGVRYRVVARGLNFDEAQAIKDANLAGVGLTRSVRRTYPNESLASQTLGFVNMDGEGQYGVEGAWDEQLRGVDGELRTVTDVNNIPLTLGGENIRVPAVDGKNIVLSLDINIQAMVEKILASQLNAISEKAVGSAVVLDPRDGRILAMTGYPSFDPSEFWNVQDARVFSNPVLTGLYEPGSVIKPFTMGVGINTGTVSTFDTFHNTDSVQVADATIRNLFRGRTGHITYQVAMDFSLNTGMVEILRLLGGGRGVGNLAGREVMYDYFHNKFGFGMSMDLGLPNSRGTLHAPQSEFGGPVQYANMSFGQGMSATPLQVAGAFGGLIGDGTIRRPWVIEGFLEDGEVNITNEIVTKEAVSEATAREVREMMVRGRGTIFGNIDGWTLGGKTGTSETIDEDGNYTGDTTDASYIGFGARNGDEPRFVIMTHVREQGNNLQGGQHAQPIFFEIAQFLSMYLR